jgi:hypothetical protein
MHYASKAEISGKAEKGNWFLCTGFNSYNEPARLNGSFRNMTIFEQ